MSPAEEGIRGLKKPTVALTRRDFLRIAGAGAAGTALFGTPVFGTGCNRVSDMNVILLILDSLRKDHVGAYGNDWIKTPALDALSRESLHFTQAYPESLPTICARRAIHTGMRTFPFKDRPSLQKKTGVYGWLPIPEGQPTLAEILKREGYRTALVTDTYSQFPMSFGYSQFPMNFGRGFDVYHKIRGQENDPYRDVSSVSEEEMRQYLAVSEWNKTRIRQYLANITDRKREEDWFAPKVFLQAAESLEEVRRSEPFFLVVDSFDPHEPWDPPQKYVDLYDSKRYEGLTLLSPEYGKDNYLTERQLERMRALYSAEITMADRWLGHFLERAYDLGVMDNTLLVLISDHGHALGEHGYTGKPPRGLWPELTDIVFLVRHPEGKGAGEVSNHYASTHDVAPTVLGYLGIEPPKPMEGQDFSVLFYGGQPESRPHFTLAYHDHVWARDESYVMFGPSDRSWAKLYKVQTDPGQTRDLAGDAPETVERMFEEYVLKDAGGWLPNY